MSLPYIGFGNDTLAKMPKVADGDTIICPRCTNVHKLEAGTENGVETDLLMIFTCNGKQYLGAVSGHLVAGIKADCSGSV